MARGYKRDSRGRFAGGYGAGALGGKGAYVSRPNSGKGSRTGVRGATARLGNPKGAGPKSRAPKGRVRVRLSPRVKKAAITGAVGVGVGLAGRAAINRALPSQKFSTSNRQLAGTMEKVTFSKSSAASIVRDGDLTYSTYSSKEGRGLRSKYTTNTVITKGSGSKERPIGMINSYRRIGTRTNIVHATYLTQQNRKKGIGGKALTAHAAHDPNRMHRASMRRSVQGQAFARSQAGGGYRSKKSKAEGASITSAMNAEWKYNKSGYVEVSKQIKSYSVTGMTSTVDLKSIKKAKKIRRSIRTRK